MTVVRKTKKDQVCQKDFRNLAKFTKVFAQYLCIIHCKSLMPFNHHSYLPANNDMRLKKQYPEFEIDEYTIEQAVTTESFQVEFQAFDWKGEKIKSEKLVEEHADPCFHLTNDHNETLEIYYADGDRYALVFRSAGFIKRSFNSVINGNDEVMECVILFDRGETAPLGQRMIAGEHVHRSHLLVDIIFAFYKLKHRTRQTRAVTNEEFSFRFNLRRMYWNLALSFLTLFLAPLIFIYILMEESAMDGSVFLGIQLVTTAISLPGFLIARNYWKKNGDWTIYFRRNDNQFIIITPNSKHVFSKTDFVKRIKTENKSSAPWSSFDYNTLVTHDGRQLHISNLLLTWEEVDKFFGRIPEEEEKTAFPFIVAKKSDTITIDQPSTASNI